MSEEGRETDGVTQRGIDKAVECSKRLNHISEQSVEDKHASEFQETFFN